MYPHRDLKGQGEGIPRWPPQAQKRRGGRSRGKIVGRDDLEKEEQWARCKGKKQNNNNENNNNNKMHISSLPLESYFSLTWKGYLWNFRTALHMCYRKTLFLPIVKFP